MTEDFFRKMRQALPANEQDEAREGVEEVFMRMPGENGEIVFRIPLLPDGKADLSEVPAYVRDSWQACGERLSPDIGQTSPTFVMPTDGRKFLHTLLGRKVTASGVWFSAAPKRTNKT